MLKDGHVQMEAGPESCLLMSRKVWNIDVEELGKPSRRGCVPHLYFKLLASRSLKNKSKDSQCALWKCGRCKIGEGE